jgi:hypothetical protein
MTWKEVKKQVEAQGVRDDDEIQFIDIPGLDEKIRCNPVPVFLRDRPSWEIAQ